MTAEQLAELKAAWPGEWRKSGSGYVLEVLPRRVVFAFVTAADERPVMWTERGYAEHIRSDRGVKTFAEAVASFRANAREIAQQYLALCGDAP